jgi:hypothetical protein
MYICLIQTQKFRNVTVFVTAKLRTIFYQCAGMFLTYLRTKFQIPSSSAALHITIMVEAKYGIPYCCHITVLYSIKKLPQQKLNIVFNV